MSPIGWLAIRWLYVLAMTLFGGGQLMLIVAVIPALRSELRPALRSVARRFRWASLAALAALIATGSALASHDMRWSSDTLHVNLALVLTMAALIAWHLRRAGARLIEGVIFSFHLASSGSEELVPADLPIACSLSATELPARLAQIAELGRALVDVERSATHATLRFAAGAGVRERVTSVVAAESACCAFLAMQVSDELDAVVLNITAPEDAAPAYRRPRDGRRWRGYWPAAHRPSSGRRTSSSGASAAGAARVVPAAEPGGQSG